MDLLVCTCIVFCIPFIVRSIASDLLFLKLIYLIPLGFLEIFISLPRTSYRTLHSCLYIYIRIMGNLHVVPWQTVSTSFF